MIEPNQQRSRTGQDRQVTTRSHQRLINIAIELMMHDDENNCVPNVESDDEDQKNINGAPNSGVQDDGIIDMHNINVMIFSEEVIRINKQTGEIVL